jgi:hypothetical protein
MRRFTARFGILLVSQPGSTIPTTMAASAT